jgi:inositol 3-alpha-galactosyltransferase
MGSIEHQPKRAWVTLLTRPSYLAGAVLLAHSLHKHHSAYPLLILYTSTLGESCISTLRRETAITNAILIPTSPLHPKTQVSLIAQRFADTWTKLRVFSLFDYDRLVFLDADMMVFQNMDELFTYQLPGRDWIGANHACVCNLDRDSWAPEDWVKENCAYTNLSHPSALTEPCPVPKSGEGKWTHTLLNGGMFIFTPYREQWSAMLEFVHTQDELMQTFMFPDQDFLAEFFRDRWQSVGYQYNALKTMRYWHPEMWRDDEVKNLHYIVDKPWSKRIGEDGVAGYLGRDGETHRWWWEEFERWEKQREQAGEEEILTLLRKVVAKPLGEGVAESLHGDWRS